ncbi:stalk domain-containing protein [Paenibacillus eucommiae]|uniref:ABC-type glycerol-3-phosphate transport system substrate-binding protein n=1 Tax=Paenibacillus eucommiae TaxID=1355755 RepID=A0ABS4JB35_9BACL|nr:stalk domain-containing protein [Paenibacillus eucommiae]MBP1997058.1 ABC-type glycerol-3-phosphate transport system substrate-binding protein [Paenibacillus eucommiae]
MKERKRKERNFMLTMTPLAAAIFMSVSLSTGWSAAAESLSPWEKKPVAAISKPGVRALFEGVNIRLPAEPQLVKDTMMVPAQSLLEGIGYRIDWNEQNGILSASHASKPALVFEANSHTASVGGQAVAGLEAAPFVEEGVLWIPLRFAAESSGLQVTWQPLDRIATVTDPYGFTKLRISTRAENGVTHVSEQLQTYIKSAWKADVQLTLIPPEYYREKINVMIAAGQPEDLMLITSPYQYNDELFEAVATDLTAMLEKFPRLKALATNGSPANRVIGDRIYGIALPADPHNAPFPAIRQDWLDRLGLVAPKTMDEFYEVLLRFVDYHPDGDGKKNTIGMTGYATDDGLGSLSWVEHAFTGSPSRFMVKDGLVIDTAISAEERLALQWLTRAYADGLIDKEFPVLNQSHAIERAVQGNVGIIPVTVNQAAQMTVDSAAQNLLDPAGLSGQQGQSEQQTSLRQQEAIWAPLPTWQVASSVASPKESIAPWNTEGSGMYIIPRTVPGDKAIQILEWLDRGLAMAETGEWDRLSGLEPGDQSVLESLFGQPDLLKANEALSKLPANVRAQYENAISNWKKVSYEGKTLPQVSSYWSKGEYEDINKKLQQLKIKVILGASSIEEWDRQIAELKASESYSNMMTTLNALVAKK